MDEIAELTGRAKRRIHGVSRKDESHTERKRSAIKKPTMIQLT